MKRWILIANRVRAQIFHGTSFELIAEIKNPLGKEKNHALTTDKPGWSRGKFGQPSSTYALTGERDPHEDAAIQFARKIGEHIERAFHQHAFDTMTIVAEPRMLGYIRSQFSPSLLLHTDSIEKDFPHSSRHAMGTALGFNMRALAEKKHSLGE